MKLSEIKAAEYNSRKIDEEALQGLKTSIDEFGDISGIVINKRSGNLICGHQRCKALMEKYGNLDIVDDKITTPGGGVFKIRYVDWPIEKERAANVAANSRYISGEWTPDLANILEQINTDLPEMFVDLNLDKLLVDVPEVEIVPPTKGTEDKDSGTKTCPHCGMEL